MDNTTFKELLNAGEIDLIMADGAQALSKKQLGTIIKRTQESIGRNIPESLKTKAKSVPNMRLKEVKQSPFFSPVGKTQVTKLKKGDSMAAILAKMFNFMKQMYEEKKLQKELNRDFAKQRERETARQEKKTDTKKPKSESRLKNFSENLTRGLKNSFDKLFKFLAQLAIVAFIFEIEKGVDEVVKDAEKFVKKIEEVKKTIEEGIDKVKSWISNLTGWYRKLKDWLMSLEFFGWKPFGTTEPKEESTSTLMGETKTPQNYRDYVASIESGASKYNASFNDRGKPRTNAAGKKLTEMTIGEALRFAHSRPLNQGAIGRYGFMPSTLEGGTDPKGKHIPGIIELSGLKDSDPFDEKNQDKMFDVLTEQNRTVLKKQINEPTMIDLSIANAIGAGGYLEVLKAEKSKSKDTAFNILFPEKNYKTVDEKNKRNVYLETNPQLNVPVSDYLAKMRKSFVEHPNEPAPSSLNSNIIPTQPSTPPKINSDKLSSLFKDNDSLKETMSTQLAIIDNSTTNNIIGSGQKTQVISAPTLSDYPNLPAFKA